MTRREFLGCAAAAGAMTVRLPLPSGPTRPDHRWLLLSISGQCSLRESLEGYRSALPRDAMRWAREEREPLVRASVLIIPAVLDIPPSAARLITACLRNGATVIVESGAGFAGHLNFRRHRRALRKHLQLDVQAPVALRLAESPSRVPYVDYTWPYPTKIRDFSRVVPVGEQPGEIIAWADGRPLALKRRCGPGTLIYLGSPLGPALWAGDREARRWLLHSVSP